MATKTAVWNANLHPGDPGWWEQVVALGAQPASQMSPVPGHSGVYSNDVSGYLREKAITAANPQRPGEDRKAYRERLQALFAAPDTNPTKPPPAPGTGPTGISQPPTAPRPDPFASALANSLRTYEDSELSPFAGTTPTYADIAGGALRGPTEDPIGSTPAPGGGTYPAGVTTDAGGGPVQSVKPGGMTWTDAQGTTHIIPYSPPLGSSAADTGTRKGAGSTTTYDRTGTTPWGTTGTTGGTAPTATTLSATQQSASAFLQNTLNQYGLGSLSTWAMNRIIRGEAPDQILIELRQTDQYKQRFPGMGLRAASGLPAMSESEYLDYEKNAVALMKQSGLPMGFYDQPQDLAAFIGGDVSLTEVKDRLTQGFDAVATAAPEVRQAFQNYFGANGDAQLAAFFLDPTRAEPLLLKGVAEAQIGGAGLEHGMSLAQTMAERLTNAGISEANAQAGFTKLQEEAPLFAETVSEHTDLSADREGVEAQFGLSGEAATEVQRRLQQRQLDFGGGGGAFASKEGISGIGGAQAS